MAKIRQRTPPPNTETAIVTAEKESKKGAEYKIKQISGLSPIKRFAVSSASEKGENSPSKMVNKKYPKRVKRYLKNFFTLKALRIVAP